MTSLARPLLAPVARAVALAAATAAYFALILGLAWDLHAPTWFLLVAVAVAPLAAWLRGRRELAAAAVALLGAVLTATLSGPAALAAGGALVLTLLVLLAPGVVEWLAEVFDLTG